MRGFFCAEIKFVFLTTHPYYYRMYTVEIDFKTEIEDVRITRIGYATSEESAAFAVDFVNPYIEKCAVADGHWTVFDPKNLHQTETRFQIKSLKSMRKEEPINHI